MFCCRIYVTLIMTHDTYVGSERVNFCDTYSVLKSDNFLEPFDLSIL